MTFQCTLLPDSLISLPNQKSEVDMWYSNFINWKQPRPVGASKGGSHVTAEQQCDTYSNKEAPAKLCNLCLMQVKGHPLPKSQRPKKLTKKPVKPPLSKRQTVVDLDKKVETECNIAVHLF